MKAKVSLLSAALLLLLPGIAVAGGGSIGGECEVDEDCPPDHVCVILCEEETGPVECLVDDDCPDGLMCNDGCCTEEGEPCEPEVLACESDADCPPGAYCEDGCCSDGEECLPATGGHQCYGFCEIDGYEDFYTCDTDEDCEEGWYCLTISFEDCWEDVDGETVCESYTESGCVPDWFVECETDADCGDGLECVVFQDEICDDVSATCPPGEECPEPERDCFTAEHAFCVPPYVDVCSEDEDCGEGFECRLEEWCECGGAEDPGDDPSEPSDENCECHVGGTGWCELIPEPCDSDADCPEGWLCDESYGDYGQDCAIDDQGNVYCPGDGEEPEYEALCVPPYWHDLHPGGGSGGEYPAEDPEDDPENGEGAPADEDDGDEDEGNGDDGNGDDAEEDEDEGQGCSVGGGAQGLAGLLLLLAAGLLVHRRREQLD